MARPLTEFLTHLPKDTVSLALRIGDRANPKDAGYVNLSDWGGLDGLDVAAVEGELRERAEAGGWPDDWPTLKIEAKPEAGGAGKMSTSWQDTGGKAKAAAGPATAADAYMAATELAGRALDVLKDSLRTALESGAYAAAAADAARVEAENARLDAKDAEQAAHLSAVQAELAGAAPDPNMDRGASALEKLADAAMAKMGGKPDLTQDELIASMEAAPDFVDSLFSDPRAEAIIAAALARKAAKTPNAT